MVQDKRQITVADAAENLDINCGSAYHIISSTRASGITKFVLKQLTDEHKQAYVETCMQFLQ
jgi:hypothetical protein